MRDVLGVPGFRALVLSGVFSNLGVQAQWLVRAVLVWQAARGEGALGLLGLVFGAGLLAGIVAGGAAADRLDRRAVVVSGRGLQFVSATGLAACVAADVAGLEVLLADAALTGVMVGLIGPARLAMTTDLVGRDRSGSAFAVSSVAGGVTTVLGSLAAAALLATAGAAVCCGAVAVTAIVSAACLAAIPTQTKRMPQAEPWTPAAALGGIRYLRGGPAELRLVVIAAVAALTVGTAWTDFAPALASGDGVGGGWLFAAAAAGHIAASAVAAPWLDRARRTRMLVWAMTVLCISVGLLSAAAAVHLLAASAVAVVAGGAGATVALVAATSAARLSDGAYAGRVQAVLFVPSAAGGLAAAAIGGLAEVVGLGWALAAAAAGVAWTATWCGAASLKHRTDRDMFVCRGRSWWGRCRNRVAAERSVCRWCRGTVEATAPASSLSHRQSHHAGQAVTTACVLAYRGVEPTTGRLMWRVRAARDMASFGVVAGELGGWVENPDNIRDHVWVGGDAIVAEHALAIEWAAVLDNACLSGASVIRGRACTRHSARIAGYAEVSDSSLVGGSSLVRDFAVVSRRSRIVGASTVQDRGRCDGFAGGVADAVVRDDSRVGGAAWVTDRVVRGHSNVYGGLFDRFD